MNECLICKKSNKYPGCKKCIKNPFFVERIRQILASVNDLNALKNTYNSNYAEIKNLNSASFWNNRLSDKVSLSNQDGMTKDRVKIAYSFFPKNARKILDIGAGYGFIEELINLKKNVKILGNDISSVAIKNLKDKFKGKFNKESIYAMKYPKKSFDAIFALEVLEHVPPSKVFNILKNIKKMLKRKGTFIVSIPSNEGLKKMKNNPNGHTRTYTENLIRAELKIAGFKVVKLRTLYAFKSFYTLKKISAKVLRRKWQPNNMVILAKIT